MSATMSARASRIQSEAVAIDANLRAHFRAASPEAIIGGLEWYGMARHYCHAIALLVGKPLETGAAIIAAFSPLTPWSLNLRKADAFARTGYAPAFGAHNRAATLALTMGVDAVPGPKVNPFARAMIGDLCQVPCDSWMHFAAHYGPNTPEADAARRTGKAKGKVPSLTEPRRRAVEATCRAIAQETGLMPAQVQAIIWCEARGTAD